MYNTGLTALYHTFLHWVPCTALKVLLLCRLFYCSVDTEFAVELEQSAAYSVHCNAPVMCFIECIVKMQRGESGDAGGKLVLN